MTRTQAETKPAMNHVMAQPVVRRLVGSGGGAEGVGFTGWRAEQTEDSNQNDDVQHAAERELVDYRIPGSADEHCSTRG